MHFLIWRKNNVFKISRFLVFVKPGDSKIYDVVSVTA